jgi:hypothetical protein
MHQLVKAMTVAGVAAVGLPLVTGGADAQTPGWNLITPTLCWTYVSTPSNANHQITSLIVETATYSFGVDDSLAISSLLKFCADGTPFYGYYDGPPTFIFREFYVLPALP